MWVRIPLRHPCTLLQFLRGTTWTRDAETTTRPTPNHHYNVFCCASNDTNSSMRRLRVSALFAVSILHKNEKRFVFPNVSKKFFAFLFRFSAASKSLGTSIVRDPAYAFSHRPSALAASTSDCPAGLIRPAATSAATLSTFRFDQMLVLRRGVNRWRKWLSSWDFLCPSIHPKQSAVSTASSYVTEATAQPFLLILSKMLVVSVEWFVSSHVSHACASWKR